jgi:hypothetical protein
LVLIHAQDGVKELLALLQSNDFITHLDVGSKSFDATGRGDVQHTWAGLVSSVMVCATSELEDDKRMIDRNVPSLLRKCIGVAEGRKRTNGLAAPLIRRAGKIFAHILWVLETGDGNFVVDYAHILRAHMLSTPEYCARAKQGVFEGLIKFFASRLLSTDDNNATGENKEERYRGASAFNLLVHNCPFDFSIDAVFGLLDSFKELFRNMREDGRTPAAIISAMNSFLLKTSLNVSSRTSALHESVEPFLAWALKGNVRDRRLKEELIKYLYIQVNLDLVSDDKVNDMLDVLERQIDEIGSDRSVAGDNADRFEVKLPQRLLFELYGDLLMISKNKPRTIACELERVAKRARPEAEHLDRVMSNLMNESGCWGATFSVFLKRHSSSLSSEDLGKCASVLTTALGESFSQGGMSDMKFQARLLWVMRCLQELAWASQNEASTSWTDVTECLLYWLPAHLSDLRIANEALLLLATMISSKLIHPSSLKQKFWQLGIFDFSEAPTLATLELVGAVASVGMGDVIVAGRAVIDYFNWLLLGLSLKNDERLSLYGRRAHVVSSRNLALLRVQSAFRNSLIAGSHKPWISDPDSRIWLELHDEAYSEFHSEVQKLHLVAAPFSLLKLDFRDSKTVSLANASLGVLDASEISMDPNNHIESAKCMIEAISIQNEDVIRVCAVALGTISAVFAAGQASKSVQNKDWGVTGNLMALIINRITASLEFDATSLLTVKNTLLDYIPILMTAFKEIQDVGGLVPSLEHTLHALVNALHAMARSLLKIISDGLQTSITPLSSRASTQEASMFDDDLDFEMAGTDFSDTQHSNASQMLAAGASATQDSENNVIASERIIRRILRCFESLAMVVPDAVAGSVSTLLRFSVPPDGAPPRGSCGIGISQEIVELVIKLLGAADSEYLLEHILPVVEAVSRGQVNLDENAGLTSSSRLWLLSHVSILANGLYRLKKDSKDDTIPNTTYESISTLVSRASGIVNSEEPRGLRHCSARAALADCLFSLFKLNLDYFQPQFGACLAWMLGDDSYLVRIHSGVAMACILDFFEDADHISIFQNNIVSGLAIKCKFSHDGDINVVSMEDGVDIEVESSSLHTLAAVGTVSRVLEPWCAYMIIYHRARRSKRIHVPAMNALRYLATAAGHQSIHSFVKYHSRTICKLWANSGMCVSLLFDIPELLGLSADATKRDVANSLKRNLLPALLYDKDDSNLKMLASTCGAVEHIDKLIQADWDAVYAQLYITSAHDERASQTLLRAKKMARGGTAWDADSVSNRMSVLFELLLLARDPVHGTSMCDIPPPYQKSDDVVQVVQRLLSESNSKIEWEQGIMFQAMLHVHEALDAAVSSRHRLKILSALKVLFACIGEEKMKTHAILRYAHFMLFPYVVDSTVGTTCCEILELLVKQTYDELDERDCKSSASKHLTSTMEHVVLPLVFSLATVASSESTAISTWQREKAEGLINTTVCGAPESMQRPLSMLPPMPDVPNLSSLQLILDNLPDKPTFADRFASVIDSASALPPTLRRVVLRASGTEALKHKSELLTLCKSDSFSPIPENVWRFAELVTPLDDARLLAIAAELLSLLGPLRPNTIAFAPPGTTSRGKVLPDRDGSRIMRDILQHLCSLLCSSSSSTVRSTVTALREMFLIKKVLKAYPEMSDVEQLYLEPFARSTKFECFVSPVQTLPSIPSEAYVLDDARIWLADSGERSVDLTVQYESWLCTLVHRLIGECKDQVLLILRSMAASDAALADLLLPSVLIDLALNYPESPSPTAGDVHACVSRGISMCLLRASQPEGKKPAKTLLRALDALRSKRTEAFQRQPLSRPAQRNIPAAHKWNKVYWVDVDYLEVAQAAIETHAPLTAILFVEHWVESQSGTIALNAVGSQADMSDEVPLYLTLLLKAQSSLSEPDGVYGLLRSNALELQLHLNEHEGQWDRALAGYDLLRGDAEDFGVADAASRVPLVKALRQLGCLHLLKSYSKAFGEEEFASPELKEVQFEAAWRAGQWNLPTALTRAKGTSSAAAFNQSLHSALSALDRNDVGCAVQETNRSRAHLLRNAIRGGAESSDAMNITIMRMRMLDDVSDAAKLWRYFCAGGLANLEAAMQSLRDLWSSRNVDNAPFRLIEPSLALQGIILNMAGLEEQHTQLLTRTSILARKDGHTTEGVQAIRTIRMMAQRGSTAHDTQRPDLIISKTSPWRVEEAKLLWAQGKSESAIAIVNSIVRQMKPNSLMQQLDTTKSPLADPKSTAQYYELLCLLSKWQANARTESSKVILSRFLDCVNGVTSTYGADLTVAKQKSKTCKYPDSVLYTKDGYHHVTHLRLLSRCHYRLAQYTDLLYRQSEERVNSPEWKRSERLRERNENELTRLRGEREVKRNELQRRKKGTPAFVKLAEEATSLSMRISPLEVQIANDRDEAMQVYKEYSNSLITALQGYRRSLEAGKWNSQASVFRMIALWFEFCGKGNDRTFRGSETTRVINSVNAEMHKLVTRLTIPSAVFLELSHQIVSRLGTPCHAENDFIKILETLIQRLMKDHPHHVLYQIQALTRGDRVERAGDFRTSSEKIAAAKRLLENYGAGSNACKQLLVQMDRIIEAYIHVAALKLPESNEPIYIHSLPTEVKKRSLNNLKLIPVLTAPLLVDPTCEYRDGSFPYFAHFGEFTKLVGGINQPKLLECHGSDGRIYRQLAKSGNDDLRQDAVIQQLFGLVNTLLKQCPSTNERSMRIRTYKVIPFSPEAGLLQWVDNTTLLSTYLVSSTRGAHERYRPSDMKSKDIRELMMNAKPSEIHQRYKEVCEGFKPVMHNFFLEQYPQPVQWFERRVAYTRSCAVNSIVGYVIGLGDRHSSNILIDKATAEFVHIDFGVTFEQGLTLKTPERVPFRLTRDIVDGMGACGVEGVMRRCCEETMKVLRSNRDALTTIIAVLVHDPILKWAVGGKRQDRISHTHPNSIHAYLDQAQGVQPTEEGNLDAERALMRVKQKLDGYEDGELRSIQGQVQQLLHDAQDPYRLASMYPGWAAWV